MIEVIRSEYSGIKCDVCYWRDDSVSMVEYANWLDRPCPQCSHPLMTVEQLFNVIKVMTATAKLNALLNRCLPVWMLKWLARTATETRLDVDDRGIPVTPGIKR